MLPATFILLKEDLYMARAADQFPILYHYGKLRHWTFF